MRSDALALCANPLKSPQKLGWVGRHFRACQARKDGPPRELWGGGGARLARQNHQPCGSQGSRATGSKARWRLRRIMGHGNDSDTEGTLREELTQEPFLAATGVH